MSENPQLAALAALREAKREMPTLPKDGYNPHFKSRFTTLDKIKELTDPILENHGFQWVSMPGVSEHGPVLHYQLLHEGGGGIEGTMPLVLAKADPQGQGSAITYARRYARVAVLDLVADEDDDGNAASPPSPKRAPKKDNAPTELPPANESQPDVVKLAGEIKASGIEGSAVKLKLISLGVEDPKNLESALAKLSADQRDDLRKWVKGEG